MRRAVYPGSFDPVTFGHLDIIQRLENLYDEVIVLVAESRAKNSLFSVEKKLDLIKTNLLESGSVRVEKFSGLTVDYAIEVEAQVIVRGIRAVADFEYEMAMANMNKKLASDIETIIVFASPKFNYISSRMVKEIASCGGDISHFVPKNVATELTKLLQVSAGESS